MSKEQFLWTVLAVLTGLGATCAAFAGIGWLIWLNTAFMGVSLIFGREADKKQQRKALGTYATNWKAERLTAGEEAIRKFLAADTSDTLAHVAFYDACLTISPDEWHAPPSVEFKERPAAQRTDDYWREVYYQRNQTRPSAAVVAVHGTYGPLRAVVDQERAYREYRNGINVHEEKCRLSGGHHYVVGQRSCVQCGYVRNSYHHFYREGDEVY